MNRFAVAAFLLGTAGTSAIAQTPISTSSPPWSSPSAPISGAMPPWSPPSPKEPPILTQPPVKYMITNEVLFQLKYTMPEKALLKLVPLRGKEYFLYELALNVDRALAPAPGEILEYKADELKQWKDLIYYLAQISTPKMIPLPAGKPLVGYYKMDGLLVGADGHYPFDSGEYNLAGFGGNARIYGTFTITLPSPANCDPLNAPIPYRQFNCNCGK